MLSALAIGMGFSSRASADDLVALAGDMLRTAPAHRAATLFTLARKAQGGVAHAAASRLGVALAFLDEDEFARRQPEFLSRGAAESPMVRAHIGFASVAEAAALMGGGPGAVLIARRRANGHVTCALAAPADELES
jgi:cobalamin biosynthesis protein CbiG